MICVGGMAMNKGENLLLLQTNYGGNLKRKSEL